jgi:8-oxo-dGTP pyrophosphatase MutT (NUDIX family)
MAAQQLTSATHLLLYQDDALLMIRRHNTGYKDGNYSVIAGHIDPGEPARHAMRREAEEEAGIDVHVDDLEFVHTMHRHKADGTTKLDLFFRCTTWTGTPTNAEPHKCDHMDWFHPGELPANTVPYIRTAISAIADGSTFSEFGWTSATVSP